MLVYVCLGVIEGGTAGVMVRALFAQQVPALLVDLILAMVTSAPAWSNIASLIYARRAQGRPKIAFLQPLLFAMCVCVALLGVLPGGTLGLLAFFVLYGTARLLWAGVETVRAVLWSVNYPRRLRARITSRITVLTSVALAASGLCLGCCSRDRVMSIASRYSPPRSAASPAHSRSAGCGCDASTNCWRSSANGWPRE